MSNVKNNMMYVVSIRFKNSKKPYSFSTYNKDIKYGDFLVVETSRGLELGEAISDLSEIKNFKSNNELKPVIRIATYEDKKASEDNIEAAKKAVSRCSQLIEELKLDMNLINAEYTLDKSKIVFVYVSENRVDFRELLKGLAGILHCRIELRQIGPRDKAKLVGGLGICGMETCCSRFLSAFDVISINMAKNQLLPLNIPKLSGQCGKLMCCLKYEDENYKKMCEKLPKINSQIEYENKTYKLSSMNILAKTAKLDSREGPLFISLDDLLSKGAIKKKDKDDNDKAKKL